MTVQLDQSSRRLNQLEEEKKSVDQSLKRNQGLLDDLKGKLVGGMTMPEGSNYVENYLSFQLLYLFDFS